MSLEEDFLRSTIGHIGELGCVDYLPGKLWCDCGQQILWNLMRDTKPEKSAELHP